MTKATVTVANVFTSAGKFFKGDVIDLPADEIKAINEIRAGALEAKSQWQKPKRQQRENALVTRMALFALTIRQPSTSTRLG